MVQDRARVGQVGQGIRRKDQRPVGHGRRVTVDPEAVARQLGTQVLVLWCPAQGVLDDGA